MNKELSNAFQDWLVELRRWFHRFPEPAYQEEKTAAKICEVLDSLGVSFRAGIGKTGVVARLEALNPGPTVAMRADMDALPLTEANEVPYKSRHPGFMHACGHDGHMTIALGAVRWLIERDWPREGSGKILFIFQPAEEGGAGANAMIESGVFDSEDVKAVFAGHLHPELPAGDIGVAPGTSNAASDSISIRLTGKGGHGAHPHQCRDPIVAGAHLITQIQTLVSRNLPPLESAVITIGRFESGTASNIIPESALLEGTLRTLCPDVRDLLIRRLQEVARGVEHSHDLSVNVNVSPGYPLLVNDAELVAHTFETGAEILGPEHVHTLRPRMGAEDFSFFCRKWGGVMVGIGCHDPREGFRFGLHSPQFDFDETVLGSAVRLFGHLLERRVKALKHRTDGNGR